MSYCGAICRLDLTHLGSTELVDSDTASYNRCVDFGIAVAVIGTRGEHVSSVSWYDTDNHITLGACNLLSVRVPQRVVRLCHNVC